MIVFEGTSYEANPGETVLECLLRHGIEVSSFCRGGVCQTCVLKVTKGDVPAKAQAGLKDAWKKQGVVLSCVCEASSDLTLQRCDAAATFPSRVLEVDSLSERVRRVWLHKPAGFEFSAGQFVQLERSEDGVARPYSIASLPSDERLEFHVALQPGGALSPWFERAVGQAVNIRGPFGECVYPDDEPDRPLLLAGTGTGLAPLVGVVRAALKARHRGAIHLYHGALVASDLYFMPQLEELRAVAANLILHAVVLRGEVTSSAVVSQGDLAAVVLSQHTTPAPLRVYLCGNPELVGRMKKRLYLAGASLARIHSDPFLAPAAPL